MSQRLIQTRCAIAGGGPAGLMLSLLLARAGVDTVVIEKHADFLRDFRGDTIHPSTLEIIGELGWLDEFLRLPHQKVHRLNAQFGQERLELADLSRLPVRAPFVAMMPQWDFLNFLADKGRRYAGRFNLMMEVEATGLVEREGRIAGIRAQSKRDGELEIRADLSVAADGRQSTLREVSALEVEDLGAPMDALWFRLRAPSDTDETQGRFTGGAIFVMLNRGDYWQCAYVIPKGSHERLKAAGLEAFRDTLRRLLPVPPERAGEMIHWEQLKLLTVQVNRLKRWWRPSFLAIGDAAHAMSPVGGVGVNLAVQDAVAAANQLVVPLQTGSLRDDDLAAVERRRQFPTRLTQQMQLAIQNSIIAPTLTERGDVKPPLALKVIASVPFLRRVPARLMGMGVRPEHVRTREQPART